jgi:RHS repeat-associated protein
VLVLLFAFGVLATVQAGTAAAEPLCTDNWVGASEGTWSTLANWSTGAVPASSDVACIGAGTTVTISEGSNHAGILSDKGVLVISGGSLEIASALEPSVLSGLTLHGGTLTGSAVVDVSSSFLLDRESTLAGTGSLVLQSGANGTVSPALEKTTLTERTLINQGSLTFSSGQIWMSEGASIQNTGTLRANSEAGEPQFFIASGTLSPSMTNTGTFEKTAGAGTTTVGVPFTNRGTVTSHAGTLRFSDGGSGTETDQWNADEGAAIDFSAGSFALAKPAWSGAIAVTGAKLTAESPASAAANLSISQPGSSLIVSGSPWSLASLTTGLPGGTLSTTSLLTVPTVRLAGGIVTGSGEIDVSSTLNWTVETELAGSGKLVVQSGATATISLPAEKTTLTERTLVNEGTMTLVVGQIWMSRRAKIENSGTFIANSQTGEPQFFIQFGPETGPEAPAIINTGLFEKTAGAGITEVEPQFTNEGLVKRLSGDLRFRHPVAATSENWGCGENPSAPNLELVIEAEVCASSGDLSESQTDFAIGGRGVGLNMTRTYNSQAAVAGVKGIFGYGWANSFADQIVREPETKTVTLTQANGSTVPFTEGTGGVLTAPAWTQDTLTGSEAAGYTLTLQSQTLYKFAGSSGRLESVTDRNGNATTLSYSGEGKLTTITDPAGRKLTLTYNAEGLVATVEDPLKHVVQYTYESGDLLTVTQPAEPALRWQFKYDGAHQRTELVDGRAGKTTYEYNFEHRVATETDPMARKTTFGYKPFETAITNQATGTLTIQYSTSGGESAATTSGSGTANATTETQTHDKAGDLLRTTDGAGHTTNYTYDSHGNQTSKRDADGNETTWEYNATHDMVSEKLPEGETTTTKRDTHGNPETIERPAPGATQRVKYAYDTHGEAVSSEDALKRITKYEYDAAGDKTAETDPEGDKKTWTYNEDSQETTAVSPRGHVTGATESKFKTTTERNARGLPVKIIAPLKHETLYEYDGDNNVVKKTDPELHATKYKYDADNELAETEAPNKTITKTEYDGAGQTIKQTDGDGHSTGYVRNALEQVTEATDALGHTTKNAYDGAGNVATVEDPEHRTTSYTHSPGNRLTEVTYSDGKTPTVKYEYSKDGLRTKMRDGSGTTTYKYDQLDRLTETTDGHANTIGYEYDLANEVTKLTYPGHEAVTRTYDTVGRLKTVTDWTKATTTFLYDADGNLTATVFPSATNNEDTYAYNEAGAMSGEKMLKGTESLGSVEYTRNKNEQVTKAIDIGLPGEEKLAYTYDENSRLGKGAGVAYEYDAANNPKKVGAESYTYNAGNEIEKGGTAKYSYDALGERISRIPPIEVTTKYGYDQAQNLTSAAKPGTFEDSYEYNGDGLRTAQTHAGTTTYMSWQVGERLPLLLSDGKVSYVYGAGGLPVEQIPNEGAPVYLHHDQQGSTRLLTGASGAVAGAATYDGYGNLIAKAGTASSSLAYDSQYTDADTGLIYLRARYYDPATAQFMTADPIVTATNEPYAYAGDDPVDQADMTGLCSTTAVAATAPGRRGPSQGEAACKRVHAEIQSKLTDYRKRLRQYEEDLHKLPEHGKTGSRESHREKILEVLGGLKKKVEQFDRWGCSDYGLKVPGAARSLVGVKAPKAAPIPEPKKEEQGGTSILPIS